MLSDAELSSMRAAIEELLPDTCNIKSVTRTPDGQGGWSETWADAYTYVACRLDYVQGKMAYISGAMQLYTGWILTLPYDTTITSANRIYHNGNKHTFSITEIDDDKAWQTCIRCKVQKV